MRTIALGLCLLLTIFSGPAFAYLDPGTGSLLVSALVGLLATLLFFIKGLFYKIRRSILGFLGRAAEDDRVGQAIVFYSEGRHYWSTFRPVIDELVNRNVRFEFWAKTTLKHMQASLRLKMDRLHWPSF